MLIFGISWDLIVLNNIPEQLAFIYQNYIGECSIFEHYAAFVDENAIGYIITDNAQSNVINDIPEAGQLQSMSIEVANFFEDNFNIDIPLNKFGLIFLNLEVVK